jgi:hypothetical protein
LSISESFKERVGLNCFVGLINIEAASGESIRPAVVMGTEERELEVTLISAEGLKKVRNFGLDLCYAVVYIRAREKQVTMVDKEGGSNPTWNAKFTVTCDESMFQLGTLIMTVEIYGHGTFGNKLVGICKIPLYDIDMKSQRPTPMHYEVRRPSGRVRGSLTLTVVAGEKRKRGTKSTMGYTPAWAADSGNVQSTAPYPLAKMSYGMNSDSAASVYPPRKASTVSYAINTGACNGGLLYPPPEPPATSNQGECHGASTGTAGQRYGPPTSLGCSNAANGSSSEVEEPVLAYPAFPAGGYGGMQYPPQQYASQFSGAPGYYPPAQANMPYSYQQAYYGRPPRRQGGSGMGMGLLGGALGGLLLGDMIGDMGGF